MSCIRVFVCLTLIVSAGGLSLGKKKPKTVTVDCTKGQSINAALEANVGEEDLVIEIDGICVEDVLIRRDRLTLKGDDPDLDGVEAATTDFTVAPRGAAVAIRDATLVFLEQLKFRGGVGNGVRVTNARRFIRIVDCIFEDNGFAGLVVVDAEVFVANTTITGPSGIAVSESGLLTCRDCIVDVSGTALSVNHYSSAIVLDSSLTGGNGVSAIRSSTVQLFDTDTSGANLSLLSDAGASVFVTRGTLEGRFAALEKSQISLRGVDQAPLGLNERNVVRGDSYLEVSRNGTLFSSLGDTNVRDFGKGILFSGSSVEDLSCGAGSDVICRGGEALVSSSCAGCAVCGDGFQNDSEQCDDGNTDPDDGCSPGCTTEECGNGILDFGESCDDSNTESLDGCSDVCALEGTAECGNGVPEDDEECEDGNTDPDDGCSATCIVEECGNSLIEIVFGVEEECDDGGTIGGDGCSAICTTEACGNGRRDIGEECDDGNPDSEDGCSAACLREFCGDGILQLGLGEECDDGNRRNSDTCSLFCTIN